MRKVICPDCDYPNLEDSKSCFKCNSVFYLSNKPFDGQMGIIGHTGWTGASVRAGAYKEGSPLMMIKGHLYLALSKSIFSRIQLLPLDAALDRVELLDKESKTSLSSALGRGVIGSAVLGPVGMIAGAATAGKNVKVRWMAYFRNGKKILLESEPDVFQRILSVL